MALLKPANSHSHEHKECHIKIHSLSDYFCLALPPVWSQPEVTASFRVTLPDTIIQLPYHIEKASARVLKSGV